MEENHLVTLMQRYPALTVCGSDITAAFEVIYGSMRRGGKLLICGNGGSASDADHMSAELLKSFMAKRDIPPELGLDADMVKNLQLGLPAIPLHQFAALMTAYANDCDGVYNYAQLTLSLGRPGDVLFCISTSGNARNVGLAARLAASRGIKVIGLTGETGGSLKELCDTCICVPEKITFKVQELHLPIYHALCLMLESAFFERKSSCSAGGCASCCGCSH